MNRLNELKNAMQTKENNSAIWLTWENQIRNRSMAHALNIPIYELVSNQPRLIKFPWFILKTLGIVIGSGAKVVFAQNPSLLLSLIVTLLGFVSRKKIVIDAHNAGLYPIEGKYKLLNWIAKFIIRHADLIIVSNSYLAEIVQEWGGNSFVMPDPLPDFSDHDVKLSASGTNESYFFFICMWMDDEPYDEVISAAALIPSDLKIYISGNYKKRLSTERVANLPVNVKLLGYVSEEDYVAYLSGAIAAIDLTTRDHCLVCGAYEAISLATPCIISESKINREIFSKGFLYTENTTKAIAAAMIDGHAKKVALKTAINIQKIQHNKMIEQNVSTLKTMLF